MAAVVRGLRRRKSIYVKIRGVVVRVAAVGVSRERISGGRFLRDIAVVAGYRVGIIVPVNDHIDERSRIVQKLHCLRRGVAERSFVVYRKIRIIRTPPENRIDFRGAQRPTAREQEDLGETVEGPDEGKQGLDHNHILQPRQGDVQKLPPAIAAATLASLRLAEQESWRREKLISLIQRFRVGAQQLGLSLMDSSTAIQPLLVGENKKAVELSEALLGEGIMVSAIRPPTVPEVSARLRITLSAAHNEDQVDSLLEGLQQCCARLTLE